MRVIQQFVCPGPILGSLDEPGCGIANNADTWDLIGDKLRCPNCGSLTTRERVRLAERLSKKGR